MEEKKNENYTPLRTYGLISVVIRKQNLVLLNKIADIMKLSNIRREEFIEEFHKTNYYTPRRIVSKKHENIQNLFARNTRK